MQGRFYSDMLLATREHRVNDVTTLRNFMRSKEGETYDNFEALDSRYKTQDIYVYAALIKTNGENSKYPALLKLLHEAVGNAPEYAYATMDYYIGTGDIAQGFASLDIVEKKFGHGAIFDLIRFNQEKNPNNRSIMMHHILSAMQSSPEDQLPYSTLLSYFKARKDYADLVLVLAVFRQHFGIEFDAKKLMDGSSSLLESPEYIAWRKTIGQSAP